MGDFQGPTVNLPPGKWFDPSSDSSTVPNFESFWGANLGIQD